MESPTCDVGHVQRRAVDLERLRAHDLADRLHDAGEHARRLPQSAR
jgi:hypothetical protein